MLDGSRVRLRAMVTTDAETVLKIYGEGIQTGHATFEAEVPDWHKWDSELAQNQGIGSVLLERLITSSKKFGIGNCRLMYFRKTKSAFMYMKNTVSEKAAHADSLPLCLMVP